MPRSCWRFRPAPRPRVRRARRPIKTPDPCRTRPVLCRYRPIGAVAGDPSRRSIGTQGVPPQEGRGRGVGDLERLRRGRADLGLDRQARSTPRNPAGTWTSDARHRPARPTVPRQRSGQRRAPDRTTRCQFPCTIHASGSRCGSRTHTPIRATDFKSGLSTIPASGLGFHFQHVSYNLTRPKRRLFRVHTSARDGGNDTAPRRARGHLPACTGRIAILVHVTPPSAPDAIA